VKSPAPQARPIGAGVSGVGLHPLALAAYESLHTGLGRRHALLTAAGVSLEVARDLAQLAGLGVHPGWWLLGGAAITAAWILRAYPRGSGGRAIHPAGLGAALLCAVVLFTLRRPAV